MKARVLKSGKRDFECKVMESGENLTACALGNLLKGDENTIVVGDYVEIENGVIEKVLSRKNEIFRLIVREQKKKVTASNCDLMVIVNSVSKPEYKRGIIDRFLVRAHQWNIHPLMVFNKMDQYVEGEFDINFEVDRLKNLGVECFEVSAIHPEYQPRYLASGLMELKERLKGSTSIFLGQSGVGKSKIISLVSSGKINLLSRDIGKAGKGTHTTTWSEIIDCDSFSMIDSPGIRSFGIEDLLVEDFIQLFPDLEKLATLCKFNNCSHDENSKGCYFYNQLVQEERETLLIHSRLESYKKMREELEKTPSYLKK